MKKLRSFPAHLKITTYSFQHHHTLPPTGTKQALHNKKIHDRLSTSVKRRKGYSSFSAAFALSAFVKNAVAFFKLF